MKVFKIGFLNRISDLDLNEELPVRTINKEGFILGLLASFFGGSFFLIPFAYFIKLFIEGTPLTEGLLLIPMSIIFCPLFLYGLNLVLKREEIIFYPDKIYKKLTSLFKRIEWEEDLSSYKGLLFGTGIHTTGHGSSTNSYLIKLVHPDRGKNITLYEKLGSEDVQKRWQIYSKLFSVSPLLFFNSDLYIPIDISQINRSMMDLVLSREISVPESCEKRPEEIEITEEEASVRIRLKRKEEVIFNKKNQRIEIRSGLPCSISIKELKAIIVTAGKRNNFWDSSLIFVMEGFPSRKVAGHGVERGTLIWVQLYLLNKIINQ